eukprot:5012422-Ditylum_brightwellii.AAC.1
MLSKNQRHNKKRSILVIHLNLAMKLQYHSTLLRVLCHVEGLNIPAGGWVGGDSWFGSIATSVEVYKKLE